MRILKVLLRGWMAFGHAMGIAVTWVLINIVYFVVAPVFSLMRFSDPLKLKMDSDSYWESRSKHCNTLDDLKHPF